MSLGPLVTPWTVAESIALRLARHQVGSVRVDAGASRGRMLRVLPEAALQGRMSIELAHPDAKADAAISIEDVLDPAGLCRGRLLLRAASARDLVVMCEPLEPGRGVGEAMLRSIDPGVSILRCDEVPDGIGGTRLRTKLEPPAVWFVASAAAWRFGEAAEPTRDAFLRRLPRLRCEQIIMGLRRILGRWPFAFELFALSAGELARRGDCAGVQRIRGELRLHPDSPAWVHGRVREALVSTLPQAEPTVATGS